MRLPERLDISDFWPPPTVDNSKAERLAEYLRAIERELAESKRGRWRRRGR